LCCDQKAQTAQITLWQQAIIEITRRDHSNNACSRHIYLRVALCAHPHLRWIALSTQHQLRSYNNVPSFLLWTVPVAHSFCEGCTWHHLHILVKGPLCSDWKAQAASMQSFTLWQQATIDIPRRAHSISACLRHIYMGVALHVYPVRGESHICSRHITMVCTLNVVLIKRKQNPNVKQQRWKMLTRSPKAVISQARKTWQTKHNIFTVC